VHFLCAGWLTRLSRCESDVCETLCLDHFIDKQSIASHSLYIAVGAVQVSRIPVRIHPPIDP